MWALSHHWSLIQISNSIQLFLPSVREAWSDVEDDLMEGNVRWLGNFDACVNPAQGSPFDTRYCTATVPIAVS